MKRSVRRLSPMLLLVPRVLLGQSVADLERQAKEIERKNPAAALDLFERALAIDSTRYEINWRAALAATDVLASRPAPIPEPVRDSLLGRAERYARRAVRTDSTGADGLFALAVALGRSALTKGKRDRVRYGDEIYRLANRVIELAPEHDGAHHVLGLWNAEVMRLSGLARFMAKRVLGGKLLDRASWSEAVAHLERAVALDSTRIFHRLDLARVYAERKRYSSARAQLEAIERLPNGNPGDERYRREAEELLERIRGRADPDHEGAGPASG